MRRPAIRADAEDRVSQLFFGRKSMLVLINGAGQRELAQAYEPIPASGLFQPDELPFEEPLDALTFTLSSLCRWLGADAYADLISLSRFPRVQVDLVPGLVNDAYKEAATTSVEIRSGHKWLTSTRNPDTYIGFEPDWDESELLLRSCALSPAQARRLAYDLAVHRALKNQFLVVPRIAGIWERRSYRSLVESGLCGVSDAFALAGAKARMYTAVPVLVRPRVTSSVNVGMWRDQTATRRAWALQLALGGALDPAASPDEAQSADRLFAIRDLLVDALASRDAIYRLTRVDATEEPSFGQARRPQPGVRGNDLHELLRYHALALLSQAFAITDNVAQVVVARCAVVERGAQRAGFATLVSEDRPEWAKSGTAGEAVDAIRAHPDTPYLLAVRDVRNRFVHHAGVPSARVRFHPDYPKPPVPGVFAMWLMRDEAEGDPTWDAFAQRSDFVQDRLAVTTYLRLADEVWEAVIASLNATLTNFSWRSTLWAANTPAEREYQRERRLWRSPLHPALWRFETKLAI
jgi:hypothetical protein